MNPQKEVVPTVMDGQEVYIAVQRLPGSEPTSSNLRRVAGQRATEALDHVQRTVRSVAERFSHTVGELSEQATAPESVSVEFGVTIASEGNIVLFSGSAEASVTVTLTYPVTARPRT
ncbi:MULTISPECIES: CU044_2847 family protein [unclassified Streptomyces]|uniref:CU044_2847 family protein n=1 Tax=unclassified Streptomyces TaxID=2593676 RepID=UPI0036EA7622